MSLLVLGLASQAQATPHSVILKWTDSPTACVTLNNIHRVQVKGSEVIGTNFATAAQGLQTFTDNTVLAGQTYYWALSSWCPSNPVGKQESVMGPEVIAVVPQDPPPAPTGLTAIVQ